MSNLIHGNTISQAVQHIVGQAWQKHTAEAMREASHKLHGIATLLIFQSNGGRDNNTDLIKLANDRQRCETAAEKIERGEI